MQSKPILFYFLLFFILGLVNYSCKFSKPYQDANLPVETRVNDLVSRITLDEKISQMMDVSVEIKRLDISAYNWWNEGLHGVARAGIATVFPQAIALSATFNDSLHFKVATAISDEFRAKYNEFKKVNQAGYVGLTVWLQSMIKTSG